MSDFFNQFFEQFTQTFNNQKDLEYYSQSFATSLDKYIKEHHSNLKKALFNNDKNAIEAEIKWGLPEIKEIERWIDFDYNLEIMDFLFGEKSPLPPLYYQALFNKMISNLDSIKRKNDSFRIHFCDKIQWLLINKYDDFVENYQDFIFKNWGKIPFSIEKHAVLNQHIIDNHPNLAISFVNASSFNKNTSLASDVDFLYELKDYQDSLHQILKEQQLFQELAQKGFVQAIAHSNLTAMNFWLSFYIHFPTEQRCYAQFIGNHSKHSNFSECLSILNDNKLITTCDHTMLRTAINIQRNTVDFPLVNQIISYYSLSELYEAEPYFNRYPQMKPLWSKLVFYREIENKLPTQEIKSSPKL